MRSSWLPEAPLYINWAITNRCNFRCRHCYSRQDPGEEMGTAVLLSCIHKAAQAGVMCVNFGGGEPLLRTDLLSIVRFSCQEGLRVSMNTNGYLLGRDTARALKDAGMTSVGVSIDSHDPSVHDRFRCMPGSHARAVRAVQYLNQAGIETSISTVVCAINYRDAKALVEFALSVGARKLNLHNFKCTGLGFVNRQALDLAPSQWKEFYLEALELREKTQGLEIAFDEPILASLGHDSSCIKGSICGKLSLNIKANGDITPCGFMPLVVGHILRDDLKSLWRRSEVLQKLRNKRPTGKCIRCSHYEDCLGGCTARAYALRGDINSPDPHCWQHE
jgi:GeoRSP system radical SAM/SPASM protein